jgi:hypothetical protein
MRRLRASPPKSSLSYSQWMPSELPKAPELYDFKNLATKLPSQPLSLPSISAEPLLAIQQVNAVREDLERLSWQIPQSRGQKCFLKEKLTKLLFRLDDIDVHGNPEIRAYRRGVLAQVQRILQEIYSNPKPDYIDANSIPQAQKEEKREKIGLLEIKTLSKCKYMNISLINLAIKQKNGFSFVM